VAQQQDVDRERDRRREQPQGGSKRVEHALIAPGFAVKEGIGRGHHLRSTNIAAI
jgi:hypothetical protein